MPRCLGSLAADSVTKAASVPRHLGISAPRISDRGLIIKTLVDSRGFYGLLILVEISNLGIPNNPI